MRIGLIGNGYWARVTHAAGLQAAAGGDPDRGLGPRPGQVRRRSPPSSASPPTGRRTSCSPTPTRWPSRCRRRCRPNWRWPPPGRASTCCWRSRSRCRSSEADRWPTRWPRPGWPRWCSSPAGSTWSAGAGWTEVFAEPGWDGASGLFLGSAFAPDSPFDTPWRHRFGGLWDVGPHALSIVTAALGPIEQLSAHRRPARPGAPAAPAPRRRGQQLRAEHRQPGHRQRQPVHRLGRPGPARAAGRPVRPDRRAGRGRRRAGRARPTSRYRATPATCSTAGGWSSCSPRPSGQLTYRLADAADPVHHHGAGQAAQPGQPRTAPGSRPAPRSPGWRPAVRTPAGRPSRRS